jgi:hypothetical protein
MNMEPIPPLLALLASVVFALVPLHRARVRAAWAKALFPLVGIIGVVLSSARMLANGGTLVPSARFQQVSVLLCGFALGLIVALILSRQLLGQKRQDNAN